MYSCFNGASTLPYTLEEDIVAASEAGFASLELWGEKFERFFLDHSVSGLNDLLQAHVLEPAALDFVRLDLNQADPLPPAMEALGHYAEIALGIGCETLLYIVQGWREELVGSEGLRLIAELSRELCQAAAHYGARLALEPLGPGSLVPRPREALEVIQRSAVNNLGISWDFFHFFRSGTPLEDIERIPERRLYIVHACDVPAKDPATLGEGDRILPGQGVMPLGDYFRVLRDLHYQGPVSIELFNPQLAGLGPSVLARQAYESLQQFMPVRAQRPA